MDIRNLMSGMAVVIDDAWEGDDENGRDGIAKIVKSIESQWKVPSYKINEIPSDDDICENIFQSASFILLDWNLWKDDSVELRKSGIEKNINFLKKAKDYFVPVFIFTNEEPEDVVSELPSSLYDQDRLEANFIFIEKKINVTSERLTDLIQNWLNGNASVYALKIWGQSFREAKKSLFSSMYAASPDWPKIFWKSYVSDGTDPRLSIINLINQSLLGRMTAEDFQESPFTGGEDVGKEDLQQIMEEASFIRNGQLSEEEVMAGDLFKEKDEYWLNIRPDCDCILRDNDDDIELYCLKGEELEASKIKQKYSDRLGNFSENISEGILFPIDGGKAIRFDFKILKIEKFSDMSCKRIGRVVHPYITRIQQRYALYLQRQGLPRIPKKAVKE